MRTLDLKATHAPVKRYYEDLAKLDFQKQAHEGAVSAPFFELLNYCARKMGWTLSNQTPLKGWMTQRTTCLSTGSN